MMQPRSFALIALVAMTTSISNLSLRAGLVRLGGFELAASSFVQQILRVLMQPLCLLGLTLYALSSVLWFRALSIVDVSVGYPVLVSLTFLLVTSGSLLFFGEAFSWQKMAGLAVILGGIQMVARA